MFVTHFVVNHFNSNYFTKDSLIVQDFGPEGRQKQILISRI